MIKRILNTQIGNYLDDNKAIVILGARQTGKTTLVHQLLENQNKVLWLNGDDLETRNLFETLTLQQLTDIVADHEYLVIDEAQRIKNIGINLKLITDQLPQIKLIVTGSSSLELANEIVEPLTGRKWEFELYPLSFQEMMQDHGYWTEHRLLERRMIYGYYPEVVTNPKQQEIIIRNLANDYLYRDLLEWGKIKKADKILTILRAVAFQIGSEVSFHELSNLVGLDKETVERYLDLLQKAFVIFKLPSFSRNLRNELKKSKKFYFYDLGIRNAVISNFNPLHLRNDVGQLWENFILVERLKHTQYSNLFSNKYFWRTSRQQEIDYVEDRAGRLFAYEFKWNPKKNVRIPKSFLNAYPEAVTQIITPDNYKTFITWQ